MKCRCCGLQSWIDAAPTYPTEDGNAGVVRWNGGFKIPASPAGVSPDRILQVACGCDDWTRLSRTAASRHGSGL